ncbi:MAG: CinA family protein [Muribaculaceae bacterium]|nr:CinA family protein [Muribaculaceae bacterium]
MTDNTKSDSPSVEKRHTVIYGYTHKELAKVLRHFEQQLPEFVKITFDNSNLVTRVTLTGVNDGVELLRFQLNKCHATLNSLFGPEVVTNEEKTIPEVLGELLAERELTVSVAESCTGGNIAHRITEVSGSSAYFLGSVVSYANHIKTAVLKVPHADIAAHGAVSREVSQSMARGVAELMGTDCAMSTTGIAGPGGGSKFKPVGTVWISVKYGDTVVSECQHFPGSRRDVIESATNHAMVMLISLLRNRYVPQDEVNDD